MTTATDQIVDLGAPEGGRYWRVTTGEPADHPDAQHAAVMARVTGSVGASYNGVRVERSLSPDDMAARVKRAHEVAAKFIREFVDYDTAEGYFLDEICKNADETQSETLIGVLDSAYGK